jgi:DNA-binding transcriptional regulator YhcF (GntR family)
MSLTINHHTKSNRKGGFCLNDRQPIFSQLMELIENDILAGVTKTDDLIVSTTQIAKLYSVNPTTAVKAVGRLAEEGILYKRPGIGMCVAEGAREKILARRRAAFLGQAVAAFTAEARALGIPLEEVITLIRETKP